ncbi:MAG: pseudouridine synthase [Spirochaetales bacterium]
MSVILYQEKSFIVAFKPHGIATVPLKKQLHSGADSNTDATDKTLLGLAAGECPDILKVTGRNSWEYGTLHRLDTATAGLVVFAKTQEFYDFLMKIQAEGSFVKTYLARTFRSGRLMIMDADEKLYRGETVKIMSYFRSYGKGSKEVRAVQDIKRADSPVLYSTEITLKQKGSETEISHNAERGQDVADALEDFPAHAVNRFLKAHSQSAQLCQSGFGDIFECAITRGFRHQIRAHLACIGHPIIGDGLYGKDGPDSFASEAVTAEAGTSVTADNFMHLLCFKVSFPLPDGSCFTFSS